MNVELRNLRAFVAVAETANFTRAAEKLMIAQPSLSYTIRQLEAQLGFRLFARTTRSTALTPAGELFLGEARAVLDRLDQAMDVARRMAYGEAGTLRIGYLIGAAVDLVPSILRAFDEQFGNVHVEVVEYDFATPGCGLDTGETEAAIVRPPLDVASITTRTLLHEGCLACVPDNHEVASEPSVNVDRLLREPIIAAPGGGAWRDSWMLNGHRKQPARVVHEAATFEAEMQAVALGRGLSIVPASAARFYARPGVRFVPIRDLPDCEVAVAHREDALRVAQNFAELAVRVAHGCT
ncbi:LysR family transcriptional regulator [Saccharopolyspora sp. NPDC000995]